MERHHVPRVRHQTTVARCYHAPHPGPRENASVSVVAICHQPASFFRAAQPCTPRRQPEQYTRRRPERTPLSKSLEHLVRSSARPAFSVERLAVIEGRDGKTNRVCYTLARHKRGQWIGRGRTQKSTTPDEQAVVNLSSTDLLGKTPHADRRGVSTGVPRVRRQTCFTVC